MSEQIGSHTHPNANDSHGSGGGGHSHYIIPDAKIIKTLIALLILTAITVGLSFVHLGSFNFIIGMIVATMKAYLVASIFMNLSHDDRSNSVIFGSAFVFLGIFILLTAPDFLFRGDVFTEGKQLMLPVKGVSQFKRPWEPTPEIVAHGKTIFMQQCVSCHGDAGHGDGPAAAALNPRPRNFTQDAGWKNGRKPSEIFKTLKEGIPGSGMASFATIPAEDRWTLSHYVASIGPNILKDTNQDLVAAGVDPSKDTLGDTEAPSIAVTDAMKILSEETSKDGVKGNLKPGHTDLEGYSERLDARTFSPNP
jgi:caa(3)-type oxidase subunit IV